MTQSVFPVAEYLLWLDVEHGGDGISNMKLQKLAYYAQGFHLALFDEPLFDECIEAWDHGPVVPPLYSVYKANGRSPIDPPSHVPSLDERTSGLLDEVFDVYGRYSAWHLRSMTHDESPWKDHYSPEREADKVIPHEALTRYFKTQVTSD